MSETTIGDIVLIKNTGENSEEKPVIIGKVKERGDGTTTISQIDVLQGEKLPGGLVIDNWDYEKIGVEYNKKSKTVIKKSGDKVDAKEFLWVDIEKLM